MEEPEARTQVVDGRCQAQCSLCRTRRTFCDQKEETGEMAILLSFLFFLETIKTYTILIISSAPWGFYPIPNSHPIPQPGPTSSSLFPLHLVLASPGLLTSLQYDHLGSQPVFWVRCVSNARSSSSFWSQHQAQYLVQVSSHWTVHI